MAPPSGKRQKRRRRAPWAPPPSKMGKERGTAEEMEGALGHDLEASNSGAAAGGHGTGKEATAVPQATPTRRPIPFCCKLAGWILALYCMLVGLYMFDLSELDWTGWYLTRMKAWFTCLSMGSESTPFFARAWALPDGVIAAAVMCPPCGCNAGRVYMHGKRLRFLGHWHSGEKMDPKWDGGHELWLYHWQADGEVQPGENLTIASNNMSVPVLKRAPREGVEMCTVFRSELTNVQRKWLSEWLAHYRALGVARFSFFSEVKQPDLAFAYEDLSWMKAFYSSTGADVNRSGHGAQQWMLQLCLYEAKAARAPWMVVMDVDEFLHLGTLSNLTGLFASIKDFDAVTFGSVNFSPEVCRQEDDKKGYYDVGRFICRAAKPDCSSDFLAPAMPFRETTTSCLGARGRRKYIVRPDHFRVLMVHSVLSSNVLHFHDLGRSAPIVRHYRGLVSERKPCARVLEGRHCDAETEAVCRQYRRGGACEEVQRLGKS